MKEIKAEDRAKAAAFICQGKPFEIQVEIIAGAIKGSAAQEREACAQIADEHTKHRGFYDDAHDVSTQIAAAIRSRG